MTNLPALTAKLDRILDERVTHYRSTARKDGGKLEAMAAKHHEVEEIRRIWHWLAANAQRVKALIAADDIRRHISDDQAKVLALIELEFPGARIIPPAAAADPAQTNHESHL